VWRARVAIVTIVIGCVLVAAVAVRFQTKVYVATATILTPRDAASSGMGALGALFGGGRDGGRDGGGLSLPSILGSALPSLSANQDMFVAILKSRTSSMDVVGELGKKLGPDVGGKLLGTDVVIRDRSVIALSVEATDPVVAAEAANAYFTALDRTLEHVAQTTAGRLEQRYTEQLQRAAKEVAEAEAAVMKFQVDNRIPSIDAAMGGRSEGSGRGAVDATTALRTSIMTLEMQREVLRSRMTDRHPQMQDIEKQIAELKKQYSKNLFGSPMDLPGDVPGQRRKEFFVSADKLTPVQFAYLKLYRTWQVQQAFYASALQGIEQLRYNEGINRPHVELLDPAIASTNPIRPRLLPTLQSAALVGFVVPIVVIIAADELKRLLREERARSRPTSNGRRAEPREARDPLPVPSEITLPADPFTLAGRGRQ
jgi:uncharacterized protein involved in exopolysaccharide biosynthesis